MNQSYYPDAPSSPEFAALEQSVLAVWQAQQTFEQSVKNRPSTENGAKNEYVFYDGPPFANGLPHYGHLLTGYVKDVFARYHTMKGKRVERRFGWDCHGLPAEMGAEKELGISGRQAIQNFGISNFNEHCRTSVMKYAGEWEAYVNRQARWVDFGNDYKTMNRDYMESVLWAFKQLFDKGLVYESYRVMPYSWAAETPLSNFETKLDNSYRNRTDKAVTVKFKLKDIPEKIKKSQPQINNCYLLAWTTTPWTLPSNLALAVSKKLNYDFAVDGDSAYVIGIESYGDYKSFFDNFPIPPQCVEPVYEITGDDFIGLTYEPLFPYFKDHPNAFRILDGSDFIEEGSGTGVVHMAPGFGEDDQRVCKANGIDVVVPVDEQGKYTDEIFDIPFHSPHAGESKSAIARLGGGKTEFATSKAQEMRKNPTDAEKKMWEMLSREQLGVKFRRQQPMENYIVDFYSAEKRLVIEVDGGQHAESPADANRTAWLESQGLRVLRFWNHEVLENAEGVYASIKDALLPPTKSQGDLAPPQGGSVLSLRGLNVIADTRKGADEPYSDDQLAKYGLANLRIIAWLKANDKLVKQDDYNHNYPHCWRTDTPIIYRAMSSWYVAVTKFRDRAVELNRNINWIPSHIRDGQMEHMLSTAPDWSISRNRFWGTPIPIWRTESGKTKAFGSIAELEAFFGTKVDDLHRPYIDELTKSEDGETWRRVTDVFDCWFESGSMPFAQVHYPFENKDWFETHFPADFITEYVGQTRGWFNTLIMLSTALFDKEPFKNCICHGVVIDEETGLKYSKRLKNYKDPMEVFDKFGADALRWLMMSSPVMRGADLGIDPEGKFIHDAIRLYIKPIWNAYYFFTLYANADGVKAKFLLCHPERSEGPPAAGDASRSAQHDDANLSLMDRYILAKCAGAVTQIEQALDAYDSPAACQAVTEFVEVLNNWYIRRNKDRFWGDAQSPDKQAAYDTLYTVLHILSRAVAPLLPMVSEAVFGGLQGRHPEQSEGPRAAGDASRSAQHDENISVHLADWPDMSGVAADAELVATMDFIQSVCNTALSIRNANNIRVRQPLADMKIIASPQRLKAMLDSDYSGEYRAIIRDEVNIKGLVTFDADEAALKASADYKLKLNPPVLGKRLPEKMKQLIPASKKGEWELKDGQLFICGEALLQEEYELNLEPKAGIKGAAALSSNDALVVLDLTITPELEAEGLARDLVRMIQQARKDAGLHVSDRINLRLDMPDAQGAAVEAHKEYIAQQVLAVSLVRDNAKAAKHHSEQQLDGQSIVIGFEVAA